MKLLSLSLILIASYFSNSTYAQVLFSVGTSQVTVDQFTKRLEQLKATSVNPPSKEQLVQDWIKFEMGVQEASKLGLQNDPAVKEALRQVLYNALLEKQVGERVQKISVKENEMKAFYSKNPEIRTRHLLIGLKPGANAAEIAAAEKRAQEIYREVSSGKRPFEDYVKLYTDDLPTKNSGGDIDYQSKVTLVPEYYEAAVKLRKNAISKPVKSRYGFHIIKLIDTRSYQDADKAQIRASVIDAKRNQIFDSYFNGLKSKYPAKLNKGALDKIAL